MAARCMCAVKEKGEVRDESAAFYLGGLDSVLITEVRVSVCKVYVLNARYAALRK